MMDIIPCHSDDMRPDQLEEFVLAHEWTHIAFMMMRDNIYKHNVFRYHEEQELYLELTKDIPDWE